MRRRLRFVLTFSNPTSRALQQQRFWCYLPAAETATQRLVDVRVSMPHNLQTDAMRHSVLALTFDEFPALAQKIVSVEVDVDLSAEPRQEPLPDPQVWLGAERYIEVDDPLVRTLAAELDRTSPWQTAQGIYRWVADNIAYAGYISDDLGAARALLDRRGDCTEFADLAVALARANGIPARMMGGFVTNRDAAPRPADYHNWAEFHLDGAWRLVDAQKQHWLTPAADYVAFRIYRDADLNPIGRAHRYRIDGGVVLSL